MPVVRSIRLGSLKEDPRFQPRQSLREARIAKYAFDMRQGAQFPPIKVANIKNRLYVIDGFHRLAAARKAGLQEIAAEVKRMTVQEATFQAIQANALHGIPLSRKDKQRCFQLYCKAGLHLKPDGEVKSLRAIRQDLGNIAWPQTISNWLKNAGIEPSIDDGPVVDWDRWGDDEEEEYVTEIEQMHALENHLSSFRDTFQTLTSPENRQAALRQLRELEAKLTEEEEGLADVDMEEVRALLDI